MDPITHALSGAVVARAFVPRSGQPRAVQPVRWALILGSIFPDLDVIARPFVPDDFSTIRFHRSITHSLVCLPVWALLFALGAAWFWRRRGIPAPHRAIGAAFGTGIGLHILFDCITSFGTMVWSPISWTRVHWDWTFIIDLSLTGVLLFFLLISWVADANDVASLHRARRAAIMLALMGSLVGAYALAGRGLGTPASPWSLASVLAIAALPLLAASSGRSLVLSSSTWCRVGFLAAAAYLGMDAWAHARALEQVRVYAALAGLDAPETSAIPLPPNRNYWHGLARTPAAAYEWMLSLAEPPAVPLPTSITPVASGEPCPPTLWTVPQVQIWRRFARFPVVVCSRVPDGNAAQFEDLAFRRPAVQWPDDLHSRPLPFTWRITFDDQGRPLSQGWVIR